MRRFFGWLCILAAVVIAGLTVRAYWPKLMDYKKGQDLYRGLEDDYARKPSLPQAGESVGEGGTESGAEDSWLDLSSYERIAKALKEAGVEEEGDDWIDDYLPPEIDWEGLVERNSDYLGWIYVPKTGVSYPVVASEDNADYLHVNFDGAYNFQGTIFMDCRNEKGVLNHHTVLYGHNMRNGSMFAKIRSYFDEDWAKEHPVFWFITPKYSLLYRVFAACEPSPYDDAQYGIDGVQYKSNDEFRKAIETMVSTSLVKFPVETPTGRDYVMTLSTCVGDSSRRCAVHGVLLGEYTGNKRLQEETETGTEASR